MRRPQIWTLFSSLLLVASFAPWDLTFLLPFALVPWLWGLQKIRTQGWKALLWEGLYLSAFMSLLGFYWVATVLINYSGLHWIWGLVGLFLFSWIGQPQFPVFALLWGSLSRKHKLPPIFWAALYTTVDFAIPKLFADSLGHATYHLPRLRQSADIWGVAGLTFTFAWLNFSLIQAAPLFRRPRKPKRIARAVAAPVALLCLTWIYGTYRLEDIRSKTAQAPRQMRASLIQANIGDFDKLASEQGVRGAADQVLQTFFRLSDQALRTEPRPDVIVWPETAFPSTFRNPLTTDELRRDQMMERYSTQNQVPLFFGGYDHTQGRDHNAFFLLSPSGEVSVYRKHILLLFGEYIPGADLFPWIRTTFPQVGQFGRGPGPARLDVNLSRIGPVKIAPIICYEALFPWFLIGSARLGTELIINITNDSWFGEYGEPDLHLALSTFRSIETRMPQIRATNTGISGWIDATGEIRNRTDKFVRTIAEISIPLPAQTPGTLLVLLGDWFPTFSALLSALIFWRVRKKPLGTGWILMLLAASGVLMAPTTHAQGGTSATPSSLAPCRVYSYSRQELVQGKLKDSSDQFYIAAERDPAPSKSNSPSRVVLGPYNTGQAYIARLLLGYACGNRESGRLLCSGAGLTFLSDLQKKLPPSEHGCTAYRADQDLYLKTKPKTEITHLWAQGLDEESIVRRRIALRAVCGMDAPDRFCYALGEDQWNNPFPLRTEEDKPSTTLAR